MLTFQNVLLQKFCKIDPNPIELIHPDSPAFPLHEWLN